jgi:hypothetical protein
MAKKAKVSQNTRIMKFLAKGKTLSTKQVKRMFHAAKPSARIRELRQRGNNIINVKNTKGNFAYRLLAN